MFRGWRRRVCSWKWPAPRGSRLKCCSCKQWWGCQHNRARLSGSVSPKSPQCRAWWASQKAASTSQPGHRQPPSRTTSSSYKASEMVRVWRPDVQPPRLVPIPGAALDTIRIGSRQPRRKDQLEVVRRPGVAPTRPASARRGRTPRPAARPTHRPTTPTPTSTDHQPRTPRPPPASASGVRPDATPACTHRSAHPSPPTTTPTATETHAPPTPPHRSPPTTRRAPPTGPDDESASTPPTPHPTNQPTTTSPQRV